MLNDEILHKWINGDLTSDELDTFKKRPEYKELEKIYTHTEDLSGPDFNTDLMLQSIIAHKKSESPKKLSETKTHKIYGAIPNWVKYGMAASILLAAAFLFLPNNNEIVLTAYNKEQLSDILPDQSEIVLNADSELRYPENWDKKREVSLKGEAYFKVTPGSTFTVKTTIGSIKVLGTQFNVRYRNGRLNVACDEGRVSVQSANGKIKEDLQANDALHILVDGTYERFSNQSLSYSWLHGITKLKNVMLSEVIEELERQYDITIKTDGINLAQKLSCNFQHTNLDLALKTSVGALGLEFDILVDNKVQLTN